MSNGNVLRSSLLPLPFSLVVVLLATAAILSTSACAEDDDSEPAPTNEEIHEYFDDLNRILVETYGRLELIVRIWDDDAYAEGLRINSRLFKQGAEDLRLVHVPSRFQDEHVAYAEALDTIADQLAEELHRIDDGEDVSDVIASQIEGPLADAFDTHAEACKGINRQADALGVYDALPCGADPYFIEAAEPKWSHRVYVNRCCGGSAPGSDPLEIFYGSDKPFERTLDHYRNELTKRGFDMTTDARSIEFYGSQTYQFERSDVPGCFWIQEFTEDYRLDWVDPADVDGLNEYPHAYAATYLQLCG